MKEYTVTIDRTVLSVRTFTVKAENEVQARNAAIDIASENEDGWDGTEYETKYNINIEEVPNPYIDRYGNPYDPESEDACWPAGGGLHKGCEFNADALYAYYVVKDRGEIFNYLFGKGFELTNYHEDYEEWRKGNTIVVYEDYDKGAHLWGYMHTEIVAK